MPERKRLLVPVRDFGNFLALLPVILKFAQQQWVTHIMWDSEGRGCATFEQRPDIQDLLSNHGASWQVPHNLEQSLTQVRPSAVLMSFSQSASGIEQAVLRMCTGVCPVYGLLELPNLECSPYWGEKVIQHFDHLFTVASIGGYPTEKTTTISSPQPLTFKALIGDIQESQRKARNVLGVGVDSKLIMWMGHTDNNNCSSSAALLDFSQALLTLKQRIGGTITLAVVRHYWATDHELHQKIMVGLAAGLEPRGVKLIDASAVSFQSYSAISCHPPSTPETLQAEPMGVSLQELMCAAAMHGVLVGAVGNDVLINAPHCDIPAVCYRPMPVRQWRQSEGKPSAVNTLLPQCATPGSLAGTLTWLLTDPTAFTAHAQRMRYDLNYQNPTNVMYQHIAKQTTH